MKDKRDAKHQLAKDRKWYSGGKQHLHGGIICSECGAEISEQEDEKHGGLCENCWTDIIK